MRTACPANLILVDYVALAKCGTTCPLWSPSLRHFVHPWCSHKHPVLRHPHSVLFRKDQKPSFTFIQNMAFVTFVKSVHHHTIQIIQPTGCNSFTSLLLDVYVWLKMFLESPRPSSGAYNCNRRPWFYRWTEAPGALLVVVWQTTTNIVYCSVL
jgi:hypothetical protein